MSNQPRIQEDSNSREQALSIDSFIIEAPAGAGKTELLTQRYLKLLQTVNAPEEIIAITFTNKAASEMRVRIMDSLEMADSGIQPDAPHKQITFNLGQQALARSASLNWQLLNTPSRLRIYTIDSLCGNLARQMPLLSRFGAQPSVIEDATTYYQDAASKALSHLDDETHGNAVQTVLRYFDNDTYKLTALLVNMLGKREQWLGYTNTDYTAETAQLALSQLVASELKATLTAIPARMQTSLMPIARYAASQLTAEHPINALLDWERPLSDLPEDLNQWQSLAELLLTGKNEIRKRLDKNMGLPATDEAKPYKEALNDLLNDFAQDSEIANALARVRQLPNSDLDAASIDIIDAISHVLKVAVGELWLAFQRNNEVDFVEIAQRALQALLADSGESSELAMRLDYQIKHLLVDEFQDTSPIQIALLKALTKGWQSDDGRTLFAVGDPMQSIYRFRKANVSLFLDVAKHGIGDIKLKSLKLWRNNRSCPAVVDWVNQAFAQIFPKADNPNQGAIQYRPFVATKADESGAGVSIHPLLKTTSDEADKSFDIRQFEAERIITIINQTLAEKPTASIAVLVRARAHLHALVTEMRRKHPELTFQAVEVEELANRQIVQDLMTLTYALHQRADRVHWLALLRAPWCGLTLADLHALVGQDSDRTLMQLMSDEARTKTLSEDGQIRLHHVYQVMQQALSYRGRTSISRWVHNTWLMLGGADCLWDKSDVQDVQAFFDRIAALEQQGQFTPELLADDVKKLYAAPSPSVEHDIQFMTLHKSKGLEFDTVILPGLDLSPRASEKPLLLWEEVLVDGEIELITAPLRPQKQNAQQAKNQATDIHDYLFSLENMRDAYEDARELYVAATRTERHLHLLGAVSKDKKGAIKTPSRSYLHMLMPTIQSAYQDDQILQPAFETETDEAGVNTFVPQLIRLTETKVPAALNDIAIPAQKFGNNTPQNETQAAILEADIGTLTHRYLELIAEDDTEQWIQSPSKRLNTARPAMQRWFIQQGYEESTAESATASVYKLLETTLTSEDGQWILSKHTDAKSEWAIEIQNAAHQSTKRIIDRTFIDGDNRWIIDYKTTAIPNATDAHALSQKANSFKAQLAEYAALFSNEPYRIQTAIFFVAIGRLVLID